MQEQAHKILFLVNGDYKGTYGIRARGLVCNFSHFKVEILYRKNKIISIFYFVIKALAYKPDIIYLMNIGLSGSIACLFLRIFCKKIFVADTGDANYELFKAMGKSKIVCMSVKVMEDYVLRLSQAIMARSRHLKDYLENKGYKNIYYIPDGVDTTAFRPLDPTKLKNRMAAADELIIGILGRLAWSKPLSFCYGWELVETLNIIKDKPVKGIIIGDGDGKKILERQAKKYGISDKVIFTGWLPIDSLPEYINAMDICLSTQTNDTVGQARTTGKLPLYLACGKYVLATDVGDAKEILPEKMRLYYKGKKDLEYPKRLSAAIEEILSNRELLKQGIQNRDVALREFDYRILSKKAEDILLNICSAV